MSFFDLSSLQPDLAIILRLLIAMVLTGLLGWERESAGKAAGIRTHLLVGIGTVLFVALGDLFLARYQHLGEIMRADPIRIVEAVVTGISFLGAGTIFLSKEKGKVEGLTTAASILATAAVGMIVGLEKYFLAVASTVIIFFVLRLLGFIEIKHRTENTETVSNIE
jgi:putative Mg2+ transporter-C (MgtC) family protein